MLGTAGWRTPDWISFNRFVLQLTGFARVETLTESPDMWGNTWKQKVFILSLRSENFFQCVGCSVATFNIIMAAESSLILIPTSDGNRWSRESVPHPNFSNLNSKNQGIGMTLSKISSAIKLKKNKTWNCLKAGSVIYYLYLIFIYYYCFFVFFFSTVQYCVESMCMQVQANYNFTVWNPKLWSRLSIPKCQESRNRFFLGSRLPTLKTIYHKKYWAEIEQLL